MNGNCHFVFGAAFGTALAINTEKIVTYLPQMNNTAETATLFVLGGLLGGVFPDIDNPKSHIGQLTVPVSTVIGKVSGLFGKKGVHHRGIFHDPIIYFALLAFSYFYFPPLIGFGVGCLSHLFLDMFTPSGIPAFLGARRLRIAKIESGSKAGTIFTWICVCIVVLTGIVTKIT